MSHSGIDIVTWIRKVVNNNNTPMKCKFCGYKWEYGGEQERATCPSCGNKTKVELGRMDTNTAEKQED